MSKSLNVPRGTERGPRYESLAAYIEQTGKRKNFVAREELGIDPPRLSELLKPDVWRPQIDEALVIRIAALLNQPASYVRDYYSRAA